MEQLSCMVCIRTSKRLRSLFHKRAKQYGKPSDVLRDILEAFVEGRLTVTPKPFLEKTNDD